MASLTPMGGTRRAAFLAPDADERLAARLAVEIRSPRANRSRRLLDGYRAQIKALELEEKEVVAQLDALVRCSGSTLGELCGLSSRSVAELLVEVGDVRAIVIE